MRALCRAVGIELKASYFRQAAAHCERALTQWRDGREPGAQSDMFGEDQGAVPGMKVNAVER